jgi:hypothetical protein
MLVNTPAAQDTDSYQAPASILPVFWHWPESCRRFCVTGGPFSRHIRGSPLLPLSMVSGQSADILLQARPTRDSGSWWPVEGSGGSSTASTPPDSGPAPRRVLQLGEVLEGIGMVQFAGIDQAHEQVTHFSAVLGLIEQTILAVKDVFL